jgi:membrane-associated phospholipid phosphatase
MAPGWLRWPDFIVVMMIAAPILLVLACIKRLWKPWRRWEALLVTIASSVLVMTILKQLLKWIFGRPSTRLWIENGGSMVDDGEYAFHWFHGFWPYDALPSGHTTIACTVASIVWIIWPKWRWLSVAVVATIAFILVITNYHFVGDVVAGGFLGWLGGVWTVRFMPTGLNPNLTQTLDEPRK